MADIERWFTGQTGFKYIKDVEPSENKFEKKAIKVLATKGIQILPRVDSENLNHIPDVHGSYKGVEIHVECDGPTHMIEVCDGSQTYLNGQSVLQTGLLRKVLNGTIIRMPMDIFKINADKPYFWDCLLSHITTEPKDKAIFLSGMRRPKLEEIGCTQINDREFNLAS